MTVIFKYHTTTISHFVVHLKYLISVFRIFSKYPEKLNILNSTNAQRNAFTFLATNFSWKVSTWILLPELLAVENRVVLLRVGLCSAAARPAPDSVRAIRFHSEMKKKKSLTTRHCFGFFRNRLCEKSLLLCQCKNKSHTATTENNHWNHMDQVMTIWT